MAKKLYGLTGKDKDAVKSGIVRAKNKPLGGRGEKAERRPQVSSVNNKRYFLAIDTSDSISNTIKIIDGLNTENANCGNVSVNKLAIAPVLVAELTITADAYIYLVCEGVYTGDTLTSSINSIIKYATEQSWEDGKEKILISRVLFKDPVLPATVGTITDFSNEPVLSRIDIKGAC